MQLSETWFLEGYVDFEWQQYRLLAYLQDVSQRFHQTKLYPQLGDVVFHYKNLVSFRENKRLMQELFPKQLNAIDLKQLELKYAEILADDEVMQELERITSFALQRVKDTLDEGAEIYERIEQKTSIEPVGILPLYKDEGYLLLRYQQQAAVWAYSYNTTLLEHEQARYRGVRIQFLNSWPASIVNTYEQIKLDIIRTVKVLPNPAVYKVESALQVPFQETFLPIAKRLLMRTLAVAA